jgi:holo-ACP synthase
MAESVRVTLKQVLDSREQRVRRQKMSILNYGVPIVSFTVNMPGEYKKTPESRMIFHEGLIALEKVLEEHFNQPLFKEAYEPDTGYEALIGVKAEVIALKENVLRVELEHPLGRLFDFDVIGLDGYPVSRESLGYPKRKCLLCEREAHFCGRSRRHKLDELVKKIKELVDAYQFSKA